jgi:hypothetical protein
MAMSTWVTQHAWSSLPSRYVLCCSEVSYAYDVWITAGPRPHVTVFSITGKSAEWFHPWQKSYSMQCMCESGSLLFTCLLLLDCRTAATAPSWEPTTST